VRSSGAGIPSPAEPALREMLGRVISERIGELFPAGAVTADVRLKSISFEESKPAGGSPGGGGSVPQSMLNRLNGQR
jgi:hypothetical protein